MSMAIERRTDVVRTAPTTDQEWDLGGIVAELRELREADLAARQRTGRPLKLPSRRALAEIVEGISAALFPHRLSSQEFAPQSVDYFVGHTLDTHLRALVPQVVRELQFVAGEETSGDQELVEARRIVRLLAESLPSIRRLLESDIRAAYEGDPAARSIDEVLACYPGISATLYHRLAHSLHVLGAPLVARVIAELSHSQTGIDIHPGAQIKGSFFIDHGTGVVIGETAIIGQRVRLYHGVTLGAKRFATDEHGL